MFNFAQCSKKVQMLKKLEAFITSASCTGVWICDEANQKKLLAIIKTILEIRRNPVSIFSSTSNKEFVAELLNNPGEYGTNISANSVHSIPLAEISILSSSDSTNETIQLMLDSIQLRESGPPLAY